MSDRIRFGVRLRPPLRDSDSALPRTYGRTYGDKVLTLRDELTERNARESAKLDLSQRWEA